MLPKIWSLMLLGTVIYPFLSAKFCSRSYVNGKWITEGDCGGSESMSQIMKELQLKAKEEKKWTVFQRRKYGNVSFFRGWDDYVNGFGNRDGDFWLGLKSLHEMTKGGDMEMKIKMISRDGISRVAKYRNIRIGPGSDKYRLHVSGYSGNATGDALARYNNYQFSTKDAENVGRSLASYHEGGWWYGGHIESNLNGNFHKTVGREGARTGIIWWGGRGNVLRNFQRFSEMKIKRRT